MSPTDREVRKQLRENAANWKLGLFYFCPRDPAFLVPKRVGIGWTVNFGSPWSLLFVADVVGAVVWGIFS